MPRRWSWLIVPMALIGLMVWSLRPICRPLTPEDLAGFTAPIETRTDRDLYLRVFQQRDGHWHHCKTWLSRQLFF